MHFQISDIPIFVEGNKLIKGVSKKQYLKFSKRNEFFIAATCKSDPAKGICGV